jgi:NitT/TauT family transport system ATP-binding protein
MSNIKFKNNDDIPDIVELKDIKQTYGEGKQARTIIEGLDLLIENEPGQNQLIALLGASGCGKSTILRYIAGLKKPTAGEVMLYGKPASKENVVGMVFQDYSAFPWLSVLDNAILGLEFQDHAKFSFTRLLSKLSFGILHDVATKEAKARKEAGMEMLKMVGLEAQAEQYSSTLSGGQRQRLAIARSLIAKPKILLMDEPFGALDIETRLEMQELMQNLINSDQVSDTAIIFVTHDIPEAVFLSDEILMMQANPGQIVDRTKISLPATRPAELKREQKFLKTVWEIEDKMRKISRDSKANKEKKDKE